MKYLVYDEAEDEVLYTGNDLHEAEAIISNHILDGYSEISDVHTYEIAKEVYYKITSVKIEEEEEWTTLSTTAKRQSSSKIKQP